MSRNPASASLAIVVAVLGAPVVACTTAGTDGSSDARIAALESTVAALQADLAAAQSTIASLQTGLTAAQTDIAVVQTDLGGISESSVMALAPYLQVTPGATPKAQLSGINLQIVNGTGKTWLVNGTGNLIIGYDAPRTLVNYFCSDGAYIDETSCWAHQGIWAISHKSGSHYLVIGDGNNYSAYGGIVVGNSNTSTNGYASVIGGTENTARAAFATVSGGYDNTATGSGATVSGGNHNAASGDYATVSGGFANVASGFWTSVSGGSNNAASGVGASVSGGHINRASSDFASVTGGYFNTATGYAATVCGGGNGEAIGGNTASHDYSTILGGVGKVTTSTSQSVP